MSRQSTSDLFARLGITESGIMQGAKKRALDGLLPDISSILSSTHDPDEKQAAIEIERLRRQLRRRP